MFLVNRSVPCVYYHFHVHVSLAKVSLSLLSIFLPVEHQQGYRERIIRCPVSHIINGVVSEIPVAKSLLLVMERMYEPA